MKEVVQVVTLVLVGDVLVILLVVLWVAVDVRERLLAAVRTQATPPRPTKAAIRLTPEAPPGAPPAC